MCSIVQIHPCVQDTNNRTYPTSIINRLCAQFYCPVVAHGLTHTQNVVYTRTPGPIPNSDSTPFPAILDPNNQSPSENFAILKIFGYIQLDHSYSGFKDIKAIMHPLPSFKPIVSAERSFPPYLTLNVTRKVPVEVLAITIQY